MKKICCLIFFITGCSFLAWQKQTDFFSQLSIPLKQVLGVKTCQEFEGKYIKNYNWDKTKKLESALIKAIPKFNLYSTFSSNDAKKTYAQAEEYLTLPSVFYRDRTMGELSVDEQDEEYNVLEYVVGFCLDNNLIENRTKAEELKKYWNKGGIKTGVARSIQGIIENKKIKTEQKNEHMKSFQKSPIYKKFKNEAPDALGLPISLLMRDDCTIEDVIVGMSFFSLSDYRFRDKANYSFITKGNKLVIKVSDIFRLTFERQNSQLAPIEYYVNFENEIVNALDYTDRSSIGVMAMVWTLCRYSQLTY